MPVPNTFGTATSAIPLSQLDANFATPITIGNTAVQLGNTVTTLNNMTLANVTISSGTITITNVAVTTANVSGTANISTLVVTANASVAGNVAVTGNVVVTGNVTSATHILTGGTANGVAYLDTNKVLTTGSALTYNGSTLGMYSTVAGLSIQTALNTNQATLTLADADGRTAVFRGPNSGSPNCAQIGTTTSHDTAFLYGNIEQMRLTSTGLGIGVTSPVSIFDVNAKGTGTTPNAVKTYTSYMQGSTIGTNAGELTGWGVRYGTIAATPVWFGARFLKNGVNAASDFTIWTSPDGDVTTLAERVTVTASGNFIQSAPTTAPTLSTNGTMVFNLTSNTNLRVSVRGSDGVTRTANLTLA